MNISILLLLFSVVIFPLLALNGKFTHAVISGGRLPGAPSRTQLLLTLWLIPFAGLVLVRKHIKLKWGKPKYDKQGSAGIMGGFGDSGGCGGDGGSC